MISTQKRLVLLFAISVLLQASTVRSADPLSYDQMYQAVQDGNIRLVQMALKKGADPNIRHSGLGSILLQATVNKQLSIIRLLLANGADPKEKGNEALAEAAVNTKSMEILRCLVEAGARLEAVPDSGIGNNPMVNATFNDDYEMLQYLLSHGANANEKWLLCSVTPIIIAARHENILVMGLLLKNGAYINAQDCNGVTALMFACLAGKIETIRYLLEQGADSSLKDNKSYQAIDYAKEGKPDNPDIQYLLLSKERCPPISE
jgi:uncharacterized protein